MSDISILGAGSYGTALATAFAREGRSVRIWARNPELVREINTERRNKKYLGDREISPLIRASSDAEATIKGARIVIYACPSAALQETADLIKKSVKKWGEKSILVNTAKGIDGNELKTHSQMLAKLFGFVFVRKRYAMLSGPSFASEIADGVPTCVTLASYSKKAGRIAQLLMGTTLFRPYLTTDVIGCELGGATKNVIAIAAGMVDGMRLGHNATAAIINLGFAELIRLGQSYGGKPETYLGLSGMGDLMLTCYGELSRNRRFGSLLGQGKSVDEAIGSVGSTIEGIETARSIYLLAQKKRVSLPICQEIFYVLNKSKTPQEAVSDLLKNPLKFEW